MSRKFLSQIADYYTAPERIGSLGEMTFVFPNKRSALFLKRYIQNRVNEGNILMPRFSTFRRFATKIVGVGEPSRFEALFMLYNSYVEALTENNRERKDSVRDFDKFIFWGDMILSDFDAIDLALADASKLYANLKSLREITADYLTEEQKAVIESIWGANNLSMHIDRFWKHVSHEDGATSPAATKFLTLWDVLYRIYEIFSAKLAKAGLATGGSLMRRALDIVKDPEKCRNRVRGRVVFVGLSELSTAELAIMDRLDRQGKADFFWDLSGPLFHSPDGRLVGGNSAVRFVSRLKKKYPMPADFEEDVIDSFPAIEMVGVPSSVGQAKSAAAEIARMMERKEITAENSMETAIVLPDPSQLMSLMLGLPSDVPALNVSIGLPFVSTTFVTLFGSVLSLQRRSRTRRTGERTFFYQDVLEVLSHPHVRLIAGADADRMRHHIIHDRLFNIDAAALREALPSVGFVFADVDTADSIDTAHNFVQSLVDGLWRELMKVDPDGRSFELDVLKAVGRDFAKLKDLIGRYGIEMQESTYMSLFESILRSKVINIEGTPLEGVQIMGVLETRAIDFENIVYLSMNERLFPKRDYVRTMIPNNLRRGYGLPPIELSEQFYAYNFLRSLSRVRRAVFFYDSRAAANRSGEVSRYLTRLKYLYPDRVKEIHTRMESIDDAREPIVVEKTPEVMAQLKSYLTPGGKNLSASTLKTFRHCGLQFYLRYVSGLGEKEEPLEYLDAAAQGNIFHRSAQRIFDKYAGRLFTADVLERMAADADISKIVGEEVARELKISGDVPADSDLSFEALLIRNEIGVQLREMLLAESKAYGAEGFEYVAGEYDVTSKEKGQWEIVPGLRVNFRMKIDRIDRIDADTLRFIDYKTGSDDCVAADMPSLFNNKDAMFQLCTYCEAYHDMVSPDVNILPAIHKLRDIVKNGELKPLRLYGKEMLPYPSWSAEFRPMLEDLVQQIFDPEQPFVQAEENDGECKNCHFAPVCGRKSSDDQ